MSSSRRLHLLVEEVIFLNQSGRLVRGSLYLVTRLSFLGQLLLLFFLLALLLFLPLFLVLEDKQTFTDFNGQFDVPLIVKDRLKDNWPDIIHLCQKAKTWHKPHELVVLRVVVPTQDWKAVLRLELVAVGRIVDDYDVFHFATDALHILHKLPIKERAVLSEQPLWGNSLRVEHVH